MNWFRIIATVCLQNIRKWRTNYRVWLMAIISLLLIHNFTKDLGSFSRQIGIDVSPWIFPFLYLDRYVKMLFFFPLVFIFCDAPFIDQNQAYVIVRAKRSAWSLGQISYIFVGSAIYFAFLLVGTILFHLSHMEFTSEWGKALGTLSSTNAAQVMGLNFFGDKHILKYFTPLQAMWFTYILSVLSGIIIGLMIYVSNTISKTRSLGVFIASFFIVLSAVVSQNPEKMWYSPISWCSINLIDIGKVTNYPSYNYIITMDGVIIFLLAVLAFLANRKQEIYVLPPV